MVDLAYLDLAGRAANLSERVRIVAALRGGGVIPGGTATPGALDTWKIDRLSGKLAAKFDQEALHRATPARYAGEELADVLSAYRRYEPEQAADLLADVHRAWLPTYRAALDHVDPAQGDEAPWREFDQYYGRLATACEPFLLELGRRLEHVRSTLGARDRDKVSPRLVGDLQGHLLDRFELMLAWAVEADANVHCVETGLDRATARREDYLAYLDATFADGPAYHRFYLRFPVLGRWLAQVTGQLAAYGGEILRHLAGDAPRVGAAVFGREIAEYTAIRLGRSDHHAGGRTVGMVDVTLADGSTGTVVYKPRCIRSEAALQELLGRLAADGAVGFATRPVLAMDGYGYEALIPAGHNAVTSPAEAAEVYRELGGHLAIFYVLGGGDLHFENILVADGHAHVCDGETVLGVLPVGRHRSEGTLLDSVFATGLLEWPRATADPAAQMKISGYAGGEEYDMPIPVPQRNDRRLTFEAGIVHRAGVHVAPSASNRVFLDGQLVQPQAHVGEILAGFDRVYAWFERQPEDAAAYVRGLFTGSSARFINWGTQLYAQLLMSARHPRCLTEPLEVDLLANTVRTFPRTWDRDGVLADREVASLWQLDVPIFTADAHGEQLVHDHTEKISAYLEISPADHAADRIRRLSPGNRAQQARYIAASLSTAEISNPTFVTASLDHAAQIGDRLCGMLREPAASAPWTSYQVTADGIAAVDVDADLYHGSAGISLFLAHLDRLVPRPEFRHAAERGLAHALARADVERIGAFTGLGGLVYLLTHLHGLWGDPALLDHALRLVDELPARIEADRHFDVLQGAAGLIPVLLGLADRTGDERVLTEARRCAEHLLRHAEADGDTLSWPQLAPGEAVANLTGFSHGTAGIGWALVALGQRTGRPDWVEAGRRAFAYEGRSFDDTEQDWYDLRTNTGGVARNGRHYANAWCNGAAGIGLSRVTSWAALGRTDERLLRESQQALTATMRNFSRLKNHTLCHGTSGNAELLLRYAQLRDEPAFQLEANVQVQALWRTFDDAEHGITENSADFFPGLMLGISGFGMHLLRLADPARVPSVLLLDPPTAPQR